MSIQPVGSQSPSFPAPVTAGAAQSEAAREARQGVQDGDEPPTTSATAPKTLAASHQEAAREAQQGIRDGDEPLAGSKVNASA